MDHILENRTGGNSVAAKHILFGGTHVVRARRPQDLEGSEAVSLALVIRGGFNTTKGNLIRSMLFPKPNGFKFYSDSFRYIRVMAMVALVGIVMAFFELKRFKVRVLVYISLVSLMDEVIVGNHNHTRSRSGHNNSTTSFTGYVDHWL